MLFRSMAKDQSGKRVPYLPGRRWVDGSVTHDLPAKRLSRLYGVNHHIVSQANPLISSLASDVTQSATPLAAIRRAAIATTKAWLNVSLDLLSRPLSMVPQLQSVLNLSMSLINQEYSGDINIIRPMVLWSPSKLLSNLSLDDVKMLMDMGERASWPKVEMVRTQTKISRTLEGIVREYEYGAMAEAHSNHAAQRKIA